MAPRAALDVGQMTAAIQAGASPQELDDLTEELAMLGALQQPAERRELAEAFACSGVTALFQNAGEESQDPLRLLKRLARFTHLGDQLREHLVRATAPDDLTAARTNGKHALYLTGNGVPLRGQFQTVEEELGSIRLFHQLGLRMMHVTYNRRNLLGDGCAEKSNGGLSDLGRAAIAEMNRVGVIVDVAHSGWRTSLEAAQASTRPMVASHTTCAGLQHHVRAKPDEVVRAICETGGLIGICWIAPFLQGTGDLAALLDHIDYAIRRFGSEHVAVGTDVAHLSQHNAAAVKQIPPRAPSRTRYEALSSGATATGQSAGSSGRTPCASVAPIISHPRIPRPHDRGLVTVPTLFLLADGYAHVTRGGWPHGHRTCRGDRRRTPAAVDLSAVATVTA